MRILAFGDVHGCLNAWDQLWSLVAPTADDLLITLGDYVDRGPSSRQLLDRLIEVQRTHRLITLLGNHEEMMLGARSSRSSDNLWRVCGGQQTLDSYARGKRAASLDDVPPEHWDFLLNCHEFYETDTHIFVHANLEAGLPLMEQPRKTLLWDKLIDPRPHQSGKIMVCGHTPQTNGLPLNCGFAICIDTWVYGDGYLTCLDVGSGEYWQASEFGRTRGGHLQDLAES